MAFEHHCRLTKQHECNVFKFILWLVKVDDEEEEEEEDEGFESKLKWKKIWQSNSDGIELITVLKIEE